MKTPTVARARDLTRQAYLHVGFDGLAEKVQDFVFGMYARSNGKGFGTYATLNRRRKIAMVWHELSGESE